jgi:tetratricopeptide (TPR) repeat protein
MPPESSDGRELPAPRAWLFRAALAVAVPVAFVLALEFGLRLAGYGRPATFLIPDDKPGYFRTNPEFARLFLPGSFDLRPLNIRVSGHKEPNTVRIVVLGESAAQGVPVPSFAFAPQLRAQLRARYPGKLFEVINTGIVAINSHVVYQIARELARFEPDLYMVYMGNNEVVGPYGPGCAYLSQMPPLWLIRASVYVRSTRTGQLLSSIVGALSPPGRHPAEWGGMSMFVDSAVAGDDPRLETVYRNFEENLRGVVSAASGAGAKTILCTVVANLKDCPPFLSLHRGGLSQAERSAWQAAFDEGRLAWRLGDDERARTRLGEALRIDPQYADTAFMLGKLDLRAGDTEAARRRLVDALHWDALRFRPDPRINQAVREVARGSGGGVRLLDTAAALGSDPYSSAPPSGHEVLFEHVHLDWEGNYLLARMMAQGAAAALFGAGEGGTGWLDSGACANALAYTPHERLPMLLRVDVLTRKPPFTNQLSYIDDEARMARDIDAAGQRARKPQVLAHAADVAGAAFSGDPDNPALAGILEGIDLDQGNAAGALVLAQRAGRLLPRDFALSADEASILMRLGRATEAERVLMVALGSGADLDLLAPVLADFWAWAKRFDEGEEFLSQAIAAHPGDRRLRLVRAGLVRASGDYVRAEREFREALAEDPSNEDALEAILGILAQTGRSDAADGASLAAADSQPRNQANNLRAAKIFEARGDEARSAHYLEAAERSGPVNATFELTLALKLYKLKRPAEMMTRLAEAKSLSRFEGSPAVTESIERLIARMRLESAQAGSPAP